MESYLGTIFHDDERFPRPCQRKVVSDNPSGIKSVEVAVAEGILGLSVGCPISPVFGEVNIS